MITEITNTSTSANTNIDTIAAVATPPGRGGIAIVRVSGPKVIAIMQDILGCMLLPRQAQLLAFHNHDADDIIDEGIAIFFPQPNSFTGEDVLELHGHGGPIVSDLLLQQIIKSGARLALPGEFSLRAFLNNKIDLVQAEAIADLIDASSQQAARSALRSLQGEFSKVIHAINQAIIHIRLYIEAAIDFSDEQIDFASEQQLLTMITEVQTELMRVKAHAKQGSLLRDGIYVAIVGKPNVGKSSILNRLSGRELAIVTDIPGTTRDIVRDDVIIDGMRLHVMDTAGIRESHDAVEREGIKRTYQAMEDADVILHVSDTDDVQKDSRDSRYLFVRNKIDLLKGCPTSLCANQIAISAKTGSGIEILKTAIKNKVGYQDGEGHNNLFIARRRHLHALETANAHVDHCYLQLSTTQGAFDMAAEEMRLAQRALNQITGEFTSDDLLGQIFASFCIGK